MNGWITHEKKGKLSEPNLQQIMFQPLIFRGVITLCKIFWRNILANPKPDWQKKGIFYLFCLRNLPLSEKQ